MPPPTCTGTSAACSTPLLPRLQCVISSAPCKPAPPGDSTLNEQGGQGGPAKCSGQILNSFLIPTQSFRKFHCFYLQNTCQANRDLPPPSHQHLSPGLLEPLLAGLAPAPAAASVCSPPGSQAALLKLGLNRAVSSKPSKDSLFHLQSSPAVGPQAFHDLQPTPGSSSYLASRSSPMFLFVQAHSHLRGLTCAVPSGATLFPRFHMAPSLLRSAQMSPSHEPSLTTLFKTAAHPCQAIPPGHRPSEFQGKARKQGT